LVNLFLQSVGIFQTGRTLRIESFSIGLFRIGSFSVRRSSVLVIVVTFAVCWLSTGKALAYEPNLHSQLSAEALRQYQQCNPSDAWSVKYRDLFVQYSKLEDSILHNPNRGRQWHFYSPKGDLGLSESGAQISLNTRFYELLDAADRMLKNPFLQEFEFKKLYETMGRLSHYVQDVTVPANVIPIYHWSGQRDRFQSYSFKPATASGVFEQNRDSICKAVLQEGAQLETLLAETARQTLVAAEKESLSVIVGKTQQVFTWSLFWSEHHQCHQREKEKFKDYGLFGNRFGLTQMKDRCDPDDGPSPILQFCKETECKVTKSQYDEFSSRRHMAAITATQKLLFYLHTKIRQRLEKQVPQFD